MGMSNQERYARRQQAQQRADNLQRKHERNVRQGYEQYKADRTFEKWQEDRDAYAENWRQQSARGQAPDPVDNGNGGGGSSGGSGGGYNGPSDGAGCGALAAVVGGVVALSVAGAAFHAVTDPLRWMGIMAEPTPSGPVITHENCARYLTTTECGERFGNANRDSSGRITGAQPVPLAVQAGICISAFDQGGLPLVSAIEAKHGYDCEAAMAAGH